MEKQKKNKYTKSNLLPPPLLYPFTPFLLRSFAPCEKRFIAKSVTIERKALDVFEDGS